jgi:hypothetical protein
MVLTALAGGFKRGQSKCFEWRSFDLCPHTILNFRANPQEIQWMIRLAVGIQKVLRPATSAQGFVGFPVLNANVEMVPKLQVATACFSCGPPDLNILDPYYTFLYMHNNHCHSSTVHLQLNKLLLLLLKILSPLCRVLTHIFLRQPCP